MHAYMITLCIWDKVPKFHYLAIIRIIFHEIKVDSGCFIFFFHIWAKDIFALFKKLLLFIGKQSIQLGNNAGVF